MHVFYLLFVIEKHKGDDPLKGYTLISNLSCICS